MFAHRERSTLLYGQDAGDDGRRDCLRHGDDVDRLHVGRCLPCSPT